MPEVERQVRDMFSKDVIQESTSVYSFVLSIQMPDGTYRFCVDFIELNHVPIKDGFPMPMTEGIFEQLFDAELLSLIDFRSGYWQLLLAPEDRETIAFCVNGKQCEFPRIPFRLCNAPATFRRLLV